MEGRKVSWRDRGLEGSGDWLEGWRDGGKGDSLEGWRAGDMERCLEGWQDEEVEGKRDGGLAGGAAGWGWGGLLGQQDKGRRPGRPRSWPLTHPPARAQVAAQQQESATTQKAEREVSRMVVVMVGSFCLCYVPYAALAMYMVNVRDHGMDLRLVTIPAFFSKSACVYNPIIYCFMNKQVTPGQPTTTGPWGHPAAHGPWGWPGHPRDKDMLRCREQGHLGTPG